MKVSKEILDLVPYVPGKPISETQREYGISDIVKLASNESPLPPSPKVMAALTAASSKAHLYPDSASFELRAKCSEYYGVPVGQILFGNGSNELIDLLIRVYCEPGDAILTSDKAFIAYKISAQAARVKTIETEMTSDWRFDVEEICTQVAQAAAKKIRLVFIANPNNPTGTYLTHSEVERILQAIPDPESTMVVLDEAYFEFVRAKDYQKGLELLKRFKNLSLLRTFSKAFGLAGLRLGALIAAPEVIDVIQRVRNPFNINNLAQAAALAALSDPAHLTAVLETTWRGLQQLEKGLKGFDLPVTSSQGNFLFFDSRRKAEVLFEKLLRQGVIVRPLRNYGFATQIRVSVGQFEENQRFLAAMGKVLQDPSIKEEISR